MSDGKTGNVATVWLLMWLVIVIMLAVEIRRLKNRADELERRIRMIELSCPAHD